MSIRCPRCDGVIPEKIFEEIQKWGDEAMRCYYCDCTLNKNIFTQSRWDELFPIPEKNEDSVVKNVARKSKKVAQQIGKSANDLRKEYFF